MAHTVENGKKENIKHTKFWLFMWLLVEIIVVLKVCFGPAEFIVNKIGNILTALATQDIVPRFNTLAFPFRMQIPLFVGLDKSLS